MFASKSLAEHLLRGLAGIGALAAAVALAASHPVLALALVPVALVCLRGCPMCWTLGLVETVAAKLGRTPAAGACTDGRCATRQLRPR
jgi:hypothetical protein